MILTQTTGVAENGFQNHRVFRLVAPEEPSFENLKNRTRKAGVEGSTRRTPGRTNQPACFFGVDPPPPPTPWRHAMSPHHGVMPKPPPPTTERPFGCGALWAPSSTRAIALQPVQPAPVAPWAGMHSLRPGAPPPARGTPSAVGSRTQPAWQHHLCRRQSRSAGLTPVLPRTTAFPCRQAVVERLGSLSL